MTRRELIEALAAAAGRCYDRREAGAVARLVAEKRWGLSRVDCALEPGARVDVGEGFGELLTELASARPVQYVLGVADFYGLELAVGEGVLVPRPETEELVRWIVDDHSRGAPAVLDVGTGSGAIAIALALTIPGARVTAVDVSSEALRWASLNVERTGAAVTLREGDALDPALSVERPGGGEFDVVVSNPPYIPASERASMAENVTEHEPAGALFVPDDDPLIFYRAIARLAHRSLAAGGALYFEIHENAADGVASLLADEGFEGIVVRQDINGRARMVKGMRR